MIKLTILAFLLMATQAHADPVSIVIGVVSAIGSIGSAIGTALGGLVSFASIGAFLASPIGGLVLGIGLQLLVAPLFRKKIQATSMEAGKVNVKLAEPDRWLSAGRVRQGGSVVFAEFDTNGRLWVVLAHCDSLLSEKLGYYLDDTLVTLDANNDVIHKDFVFTRDYSPVNNAASGTRKPFRLWTYTFTAANPIPTAPTPLRNAFPGVWTEDHKLTGITFSVMRCLSVPMEHRYKVYKWRGALGMGEPAVSVLGFWEKPYDPRTGTYVQTRNPALIWAWFRMHRYGRDKGFDSINWERIAEQANICDETVIDKDGNPHKRYECGIAIPENKERAESEAEILMTCDGQLVFDDDGKCWVRVGYFYTPSLALTRNRDIMAVESVEANNGESETQGVIVRYTDPNANYTAQPSAPWKNPNFYKEGETPRYITVDALGIQDHNQAMRLAKSIGYRSQALHKLMPTCSIRGLRASQERIIEFNYDNTFAGDYEIVTPVEIDRNGMFCGFGIVPVDEDRWKLLPGEEASQPVYQESTSSSEPVLSTSVSLAFDGVRITATYDEIPRSDWRYEFQYKRSTESVDAYLNMEVKTLENIAVSGGVVQNSTYHVRYRTVTAAGRMTDWKDPPDTINTIIIAVTGTPVTTAEVGTPYAGFTVSASGGVPPYAFVDIFNRLPSGISIDVSTGVVSGTPIEDGTFSDIIIRVSDMAGAFANLAPFTVTVDP